MEQQGNKLVYLVAGLAIILLIIVFAWLVFGRKQVVSPVPEEGIKVIFTNPTPTPIESPSPTASPTPSPTPKASPKPTPKPSVTPTPTPPSMPTPASSPSPSPTTTPSATP